MRAVRLLIMDGLFILPGAAGEWEPPHPPPYPPTKKTDILTILANVSTWLLGSEFTQPESAGLTDQSEGAPTAADCK